MNVKLAKSCKASIGMMGAFASIMLFAGPLAAQDSSPLSLADRVSRLEQQAHSQDQGGTSLVNQIQQLQAQIQQQQGQIEELQHQLQELQDKSKSQYIDLDSRLGRLEGGGNGGGGAASPAPNASPSNSQVATPAPAPAPSSSGPAPSSADAQASYNKAFNALRGGDYVNASRAFRAFIQQYPNDALTPNAYYWLGESYYVTMNYPVASEAFQRLLSQFPKSEKAPDAMLKLGYSQIELKQVDAAKATLGAVVSKYPGSNAAGLAKQRLARLQSQPAG